MLHTIFLTHTCCNNCAVSSVRGTKTCLWMNTMCMCVHLMRPLANSLDSFAKQNDMLQESALHCYQTPAQTPLEIKLESQQCLNKNKHQNFIQQVGLKHNAFLQKSDLWQNMRNVMYVMRKLMQTWHILRDRLLASKKMVYEFLSTVALCVWTKHVRSAPQVLLGSRLFL